MSLDAVLLLIFMVIVFTTQGSLSKVFSMHYQGPALAATPVYASVTGAACALATWCMAGFAYAPSTQTLWLGLANGVTLFLYNVAAVNAARTGPYSLQSLMATLGSIVLPLLASLLLWREPLVLLHYIGIALMLLAAALFHLKGLNVQEVKKGYRGWVVLLLVSNGVFGVLMASQQRVMDFTQRNEMIITTYGTSAAISAAFLLLTQKAQAARAYRMGRTSGIALLVSGAVVATGVNLLMRALQLIPAPILYTINNGGVLMLAVLLGTVIWKEKFTFHKGLGLALAVVAIALLGQAN
ncbi:MAG TPA: hypothetical protein GX722_08345 [Clostridiales bacterium]|nr:hypothetical protein [Clostridiales bacterium]